MISIINELSKIWKDSEEPFLIHNGKGMKFSEVLNQSPVDLTSIKVGDVVAIIGDFDPESILTLLRLIELKVIIVPLTIETSNLHEYFFDVACVDAVITNGKVVPKFRTKSNDLLERLKHLGHGGIILFSTGTTGRPKAILHDLNLFLKRFETPRPAFRTLNFLLFDHIGGINTLLHTLFNKGVIVCTNSRTIERVLEVCQSSHVEVLPATPTFLRMLLLSGRVPTEIPDSLRIITYGTERMDQQTLDQLCELLPNVDLRQTYGMSEVGILRVKSEARNSLFMTIGGEGIETQVVQNILQIRTKFGMIGYLNSDTPFDENGWYKTGDVVETKGQFFKIIGRLGDEVNVGGLKFMASEVERVALDFEGLAFVRVVSRKNPITGEHVELIVQPKDGATVNVEELREFLIENLQPHMVPKRIKLGEISVNHRLKKN